VLSPSGPLCFARCFHHFLLAVIFSFTLMTEYLGEPYAECNIPGRTLRRFDSEIPAHVMNLTEKREIPVAGDFP